MENENIKEYLHQQNLICKAVNVLVNKYHCHIHVQVIGYIYVFTDSNGGMIFNGNFEESKDFLRKYRDLHKDKCRRVYKNGEFYYE